MDWSSTETVKGTAKHERGRHVPSTSNTATPTDITTPESGHSSLPVEGKSQCTCTGEQAPAGPRSFDADQGGLSSATQFVSVSGNQTGMQVDTELGPAVLKTGEKLSGDSLTTPDAIPVIPASKRAALPTRDGMDGADVEEVCGSDSGRQTAGCAEPAGEITHSSAPAGSVRDEDTSSDRPPVLSSADEAETTTASECEREMMEVTSISSAGPMTDCVPDLSEAAGQSQGDSALEESPMLDNEGAESAVESMHRTASACEEYESPVVPAVSEPFDTNDSAVSLPMETHDVLEGSNQDESSCGPSVQNDHSDDGEDIITLSEEDSMIPDLVISNVCSVRDDGTFFDDENNDEEEDCHTQTSQTHESSRHQSVYSDAESAENNKTGEEIRDCLPESGVQPPPSGVQPPPSGVQPPPSGVQPPPSGVQPPESAQEGTEPEEDCQGLPSSPQPFPTSDPIQQAASPAVHNASEPGTEPADDATISSLSSRNPKGRSVGDSHMSNDASEELSTGGQEQKTDSEDTAGLGSSRRRRRKAGDDAGSLIVKLETEDPGYETGPAASLPGSTHLREPSSISVGSRGSSSRKRTRSALEPEGESITTGMKKRVIDISGIGSVTAWNILREGSGSSARGCQVGQGGARSATDAAQSRSTQAGAPPQPALVYSTLSKPLVIPSNLTTKRVSSVTPVSAMATKSVVLTIPVSLGGKIATKKIHSLLPAKGLSQYTSSQKESSLRSNASEPVILVHSSAAASSIHEPGAVKKKWEYKPAPTSLLQSNPVVTQAKQKGSTPSRMVSLLRPSQTVSSLNPQGVSTAGASLEPVRAGSCVMTSASSGTAPTGALTVVNPPPPGPWTHKPVVRKVVKIAPQPGRCADPSPQAANSVGPGSGGKGGLPVNASTPSAPSSLAGDKAMHTVVIQTSSAPSEAFGASSSSQHIRFDQVSAGSKLSASDMSQLIQGKNLLPSLDLRPGGSGSRTPSSVYRCVECGVIYCTMLGYTAHVKRTTMVIRYACMACRAALVFFNRCTFLAHIRRHTAGRMLSLKSNRMSVSSLPRELLPQPEVQFMNPIHGSHPQPVKCTECGRKFPQVSDLAAHFSGVEFCTFEHTCEHCRMEMPTPCSLRAHLRLHHATLHTLCASAPYVCPECGLQYSNRLALYQHLFATCLHFSRCLGLHCFACTDRFPRLQTLKDHIYASHHNHKRYRCTSCRQFYRSLNAFTGHLSSLHPDATESIGHTVESSCAYCCGEWMPGRKHARTHAEQVKVKTPFVFTCQFCEDFTTFTHVHKLLLHLNEQHEAYRFTCTLCKQGFVTLSLLRAHILSVHTPQLAREDRTSASPPEARDDRTSASPPQAREDRTSASPPEAREDRTSASPPQAREDRTSASPPQARVLCSVCWGTALTSESALPHVMWHVVRKVTEVKASEGTSSSQHANKKSMVCTVPETHQTDAEAFLCRTCGRVFSTSQDLHQHMAVEAFPACSRYPACPNCEWFSLSKSLYYRSSPACGVERGGQSVSCQSDQEERSPELISVGHSQGEDEDGIMSTTNAAESDLGNQTSSQSSPHQNLAHPHFPDQQPAQNPACPITLANSNQADSRETEEAACADSSRQATGHTHTTCTVHEKSTSSSIPGQKSLLSGEKSASVSSLPCASSPLCGLSPPGGREASTCSRLSGLSAPGREKVSCLSSPGEMVAEKERETSETRAQFPRSRTILILCRKRKSLGDGEMETTPTDTTPADTTPADTTPADSAEAECQQLYHLCHLCGLTYTSPDQLASHRASVHRGEKTVLSCQLCQKKGTTLLLSKKNLKKHLVRRHNLAKPVAERMAGAEASFHTRRSPDTDSCSSPTPPADSNTSSISDISNTSDTSIVKRLRTAEGDQQTYVCAKCRFSSASQEDFHRHIANHAVEHGVQCQDCGLSFSTLSSLKKHLFLVHRVRQPAAYVAQHGLHLQSLPGDLSSHMDTLAPFTQPEVVIRKAGGVVVHEGFHNPQPPSPLPQRLRGRVVVVEACWSVVCATGGLRARAG
ncbi:hypothetical protein ACOMHN_021467 [Nucella lapillus]